MIDQQMTLVTRSEGLTVTNPDQYKAAGEWLKLAKDLKKKIVAHHKPMKDKANEAKAAIVDAEKAELEPLLTSIAIVEGKMLGWKTAHDKKQLADLPPSTSTAVAYAETVEAKGTSVRTRWHAEITDKEQVLRWVLAELDGSPANADVLDGIDINVPYFNEKARLMESKLNIPGVSAISEQGITSRG